MALGAAEVTLPRLLKGRHLLLYKAPNAGIASGEVEVTSPMSLESETPFGE
jgi:hypothetical protein